MLFGTSITFCTAAAAAAAAAAATGGGGGIFGSSIGSFPPILLSVPAGVQDLYLTFYQYLRSEGGGPRVIVTAADGTVLLDSLLQLNLEPGEETSSGSYHAIPLGVVTSNLSQMTIQFDVEGALDFWLLDDVRLERTRPDRPTFPLPLGPTAYLPPPPTMSMPW